MTGESDEGGGAGPGGVVLAAGMSRRMGGRDKLLLEIDGVPMVRRVVDTALVAGLDPVVVVVGQGADRVRRALTGVPVACVENPNAVDGLSSSLRSGLVAVGDVEAVVVLLADMPWVRPEHVRALVTAFDPGSGREICVPVAGGRRGNPVLWSSRFFPEMRRLRGDVGAKALMESHSGSVYEVALDDDAVLRDIDTPDAWSRAVGPEASWRP